MIPETGILDWLSSTLNLGNNILPLYDPEIGILDWLSSTPNLGNDISPLCGPRFRGMIYCLYIIPEFGE